jgi:hypothetical protein
LGGPSVVLPPRSQIQVFASADVRGFQRTRYMAGAGACPGTLLEPLHLRFYSFWHDRYSRGCGAPFLFSHSFARTHVVDTHTLLILLSKVRTSSTNPTESLSEARKEPEPKRQQVSDQRLDPVYLRDTVLESTKRSAEHQKTVRGRRQYIATSKKKHDPVKRQLLPFNAAYHDETLVSLPYTEGQPGPEQTRRSTCSQEYISGSTRIVGDHETTTRAPPRTFLLEFGSYSFNDCRGIRVFPQLFLYPQ